ncbi:MAG: c-type cytochrome [Bacteroidota bacterium]
MKADMTGPALGGVQERWESSEDLYSWIRNNQLLIASGNAKAIEISKWDASAMTAFNFLTDDEITNILGYIQGKYDGSYNPGVGVVIVDPNLPAKPKSNLMYYLIFGILGILALVLSRIISNLKYLNDVKEAGEDGTVERSTLFDTLTSKGVIGFLIFALVVIGGYTTINNAIALNRQQGYAPQQPIKFSHKTHAGLNKIDCQYCHDGARRSKHSVIPATNTCMNCHSAIKVGSTYGTAELTKIYVSAGYDPRGKGQYFDNKNMSQEELAEIYKSWIAEQYLAANDLDKLDRAGEREVEEQWAGIVASLTNDLKPELQGPIEWVKIHNLPDHVYFNHAQHVTVGKIECQQCHGKVEEMEVVKQHAPLSMGWCINCHRETEVKFTDNPYYESYAKYHDEIKAGTKKAVTVEDIGGLECQKCHY